MATDVQIRPPDAPAPLDYAVSNVVEIVPKAVYGTFDGTGAGGPFLPCLVVISPSGDEVARIAAPQVAAGASATVSWFPGGRVAAAAAAGVSLDWATAHLRVPFPFPDKFTVPAGSSVFMPWANTATGGTAIAFSTTTLPDDTLTLSAAGWYLLQADAGWDIVPSDTYDRYGVWDPHVLDNGAFSPVSRYISVGEIYTEDTFAFLVTAPPVGISFRVFNGDLGNPHDVHHGHLTAIYLGAQS